VTAAQANLAVSAIAMVESIATRYAELGRRDELIAQGCLGLVRAACRFDPSRRVKFSSYAWTCIRGEIFEYRRRYAKAWGRMDFVPDFALVPGKQNTVATVEQNERRRWVRRAISALRPQQQGVLHARYWEGRKLRDIGRELGITEAGACQRIAAARRAVRGILVGGEE